jgi:hypothetical protein
MTPSGACSPFRRRLAAALALALAAAGTTQAHADDADASATVKLIQILIAKGILTQDQAASLLQQAQAEAKAAHVARTKPPARPAPAAAATAAAPTAPPAAEPPPPPGTVRVTYVPQIVRDQIAQQVRTEVMQQAQAEGWAAPNQTPEWTQRVHFYGDIRMRAERVLEDRGNQPVPDFNSINSGSGFDTSGGGGLPPSLNTTENRTLPLLRARLGMTAEVNDWASIDFRIATGNDSSPVSTQQTLGSPGNFSKYALWVDTAYLTMQLPKPLEPFQSLKMVIGREPNPFWTSDLLYWDDLNFDGAAISAVTTITDRLDLFASAGAFSLFDTALNYSSLNEDKFSSHDKYLFAGQLGGTLRPLPDLTAKAALGFFAYTNIQGKLSDPCVIIQTGFGCDTDATRAQFVQYGNTVFPVRNISLTGTSTATPEYFGLASRFDVLDLHGQLSYAGLAVPVSLEGDFSKNLGFNRRAIASLSPVNNLSAGSNSFHGGDTGYMAKLTVGKQQIAQRWDWNVFIAYKYIESDAVLDALNDPNFHYGGTNAKGFILGGNLGIGKNVSLDARWYSASQITGTPDSNDLVLVDLNAKF